MQLTNIHEQEKHLRLQIYYAQAELLSIVWQNPAEFSMWCQMVWKGGEQLEDEQHYLGNKYEVFDAEVYVIEIGLDRGTDMCKLDWNVQEQ